jgi:hypothetical protein
VIVEAFSPNETPFELLNTTLPILLLVVPALKLITAAPAAAAESDRVNPALLLAVVPVKLVRARVGFPWLWSDAAAVVSALCEPKMPCVPLLKLMPLELVKLKV